MAKNPNWQEANQLAIYKRGRGFELQTTKDKSSQRSGRDSNSGPPDYKSGALTIRPRCLQKVGIYLRNKIIQKINCECSFFTKPSAFLHVSVQLLPNNHAWHRWLEDCFPRCAGTAMLHQSLQYLSMSPLNQIYCSRTLQIFEVLICLEKRDVSLFSLIMVAVILRRSVVTWVMMNQH